MADMGLPGSSIIIQDFLPMVDDQSIPRSIFFFFKMALSSLSYSPLGATIMIMSLVLFENEFLHIVSISFTALILNELFMVAIEITTW